MKNIFIPIPFLLSGVLVKSQVGINNENPKATLQIDAKNAITPESIAGLGVPIVDKFPAVFPTNNQNGMLIYLNNTTDNGLEGFYYWDAISGNWEYIVDFKAQGLDISRTVASGNSFTPNNMSGTGAQNRFVPLTAINSLDPSFSLTSSGGLKVGKKATYYLVFTGGVFKTGSNVINDYSTEILVNGIPSSALSSSNSAPGGPPDGRSATFYIATITDLEQGDVLTIRTSRNSTGANTVSVDTPYTLTLVNLD